MIGLTYFPSLRNAQGQRFRTSWPRVVERLRKVQTCERKEDAHGFSLATFKDDYRLEKNVEAVYAVGLDLDKDLPAWDVLAAGFQSVSCFVHTTHSSTPEALRARVFIQLSRPVTGEEYRRVYAFCVGVVERGGLVVDRKASDPSRFWFLPSIRPGASFAYTEGCGKPVDVEGALHAVPRPAPPPPPPRREGSVPSNAEERAARYLDRCDPAIEGSGGDDHTFLIAQRMVRGFCLDEDTAYRLLAQWNQRCEPPWTERDLRRKIRQAATRGTFPEGSLLDAQRRRA